MHNDDQEVELVKNFIREYGPWIVGGIVLGLGAMFGWRTMQDGQLTKAQQQTDLYEQTFEQLSGVDAWEQAQFALEANQELEGTEMAALMQLQLAKIAVESNELEQGLALLTEAVKQSKNAEIKQVALLRQARVAIALTQYSLAKTSLDQVKDQAYLGLKYEVQGDLYAAQEQWTQARQAYLQAIDASQPQPSPYLQMKYDNLAASE